MPVARGGAGAARARASIDCLDGKVVARTMSTSPNAELVNTMLYDAAATLGAGERPAGHNDRGCRYRRPGRIEGRERHGITRSMSRKGCSPDDSATEASSGVSRWSSSTATTGESGQLSSSWAHSATASIGTTRSASRCHWED